VKIQIPFTLDLSESIGESLGSASLDGLGPNESTEYAVADVELHLHAVDGDEVVGMIAVEVERIEGMSASASDVKDALVDQLGEIDGMTAGAS
jgi:hypothetical protein